MGVAINLNYGGYANGYGGGDASQTYVPGWSAFTVNMRSSTTQTTFDKRLFTIMPDGNVTVTNGFKCTGFANCGTSYYQGYGTDCHIFRTANGTDIMSLKILVI